MAKTTQTTVKFATPGTGNGFVDECYGCGRTLARGTLCARCEAEVSRLEDNAALDAGVSKARRAAR